MRQRAANIVQYNIPTPSAILPSGNSGVLFSKTSVAQLKHSLKRLSETPCPVERFSLLRKVSEAKRYLGNFEGTIRTSMRVESIAAAMDNDLLYCKSLISRALSFLWFGKVKNALSVTEQCLARATILRSHTIQCRCLLLMAKTDLINGYPEQCLVHLKMAEELAATINNREYKIATKLTHCELLALNKDLEQAEVVARAAIAFAEEEITSPLTDEIKVILGTICLKAGKTEQALELLSLKRHGNHHSLGWGMSSNIRLASVHLKNGRTREAQKVLSAIRYSALPVYEQILFAKAAMLTARSLNNTAGYANLADKLQNLLATRGYELASYANNHIVLAGLEETQPCVRLIDNGRKTVLSVDEFTHLNKGQFHILLDSTKMLLYRNGSVSDIIPMRGKTGQLLKLFLMNNEQTLNHKQIYEQLWNRPFNYEFNDNNVYVNMCKVRKLLRDSKVNGEWQILRSLPGGSYKFAPPASMRWGIITPLQE